MEDTVIVIMLKDAETGFLEKELGAYTLPENSGLIFNIYAENEGLLALLFYVGEQRRNEKNWNIVNCKSGVCL